MTTIKKEWLSSQDGNDTEYVNFLHSLGLSFDYDPELYDWVSQKYAEHINERNGRK